MDNAQAARVLDELLRHPGWTDADVAYTTGVHSGAVARLRRELGLDGASKRASSHLRRRVPGGRLAAVEDGLGAAILRVAPRPGGDRYYRGDKYERDRPPLKRQPPHQTG
jgi:hypothetical protein